MPTRSSREFCVQCNWQKFFLSFFFFLLFFGLLCNALKRLAEDVDLSKQQAAQEEEEAAQEAEEDTEEAAQEEEEAAAREAAAAEVEEEARTKTEVTEDIARAATAKILK